MDPFKDYQRICCCVQSFPETEDLRDDVTCYCYPRWLKSSILLYGKKRSFFPFHCIIGPHWPIVLSTYFQIIGFTILFIFLVSEYMSPEITIVTIISMSLLLVAYTVTACSDPGIVYKTSENEVPEQRDASPVEIEYGNAMEMQLLMECSQCNLMRPQTARHCHFCNVCVNKVIL